MDGPTLCAGDSGEIQAPNVPSVLQKKRPASGETGRLNRLRGAPGGKTGAADPSAG
jgi:hypothetical protein